MNIPIGREFPKNDGFRALAIAVGSFTSVLKFDALPRESSLHPSMYGHADGDVISVQGSAVQVVKVVSLPVVTGYSVPKN